MTVKELIEELQKYPKDLKVWVSDGGYCEGATPLKGIEKEVAWEAGLDGDAVGDEWEYMDKSYFKGCSYPHKTFEVGGDEIIVSKYILMINGEY
jgi:hypothetical protein